MKYRRYNHYGGLFLIVTEIFPGKVVYCMLREIKNVPMFWNDNLSYTLRFTTIDAFIFPVLVIGLWLNHSFLSFSLYFYRQNIEDVPFSTSLNVQNIIRNTQGYIILQEILWKLSNVSHIVFCQ